VKAALVGVEVSVELEKSNWYCWLSKLWRIVCMLLALCFLVLTSVTMLNNSAIGEEITVSYCYECYWLIKQERQRILKKGFLFYCICTRCNTQDPVNLASESLAYQIVASRLMFYYYLVQTDNKNMMHWPNYCI